MKAHRKERIKLVKDLSQGENNLCQSLVDINEFDNIDETYERRKTMFNIIKRNVSLKPNIPISEEAAQYDMTPTEKVQIYKKQKIKERYNQASIDRLKKMFKIRRSRIPNLLNGLNESMKKNTEEVFDKEIKKSEEKLKFYRSQGRLNENVEQNSDKKDKLNQKRCKFYSLKTGRPQMNQQLFPTFQEYVDGKNRAKLQQKYHFNISKIEKDLGTFCTEIYQNPEEQSEQIKSSMPLSILAGRWNKPQSNLTSNRDFSQGGMFSQRLVQSKTENFKKRTKMNSNIERFSESYIEKSERSSHKIVRTMTNFYKSKNTKKQQYNNMVEYYQHDRPLTNEIRRSQYQFMKPDQKLKDLKHYRNESQDRRQKILSFNSHTYKQILGSLSKYHEDDIPISLEILRNIKQLMRREYIFGEEDVRKFLREVKKKSDQFFKKEDLKDGEDQKEDFMIQAVIDVMNRAYGYRIFWVDI